jgi:hypothetical protein
MCQLMMQDAYSMAFFTVESKSSLQQLQQHPEPKIVFRL